MVRLLDAAFGFLAVGTGGFVFHLWTMPSLEEVPGASALMAVVGGLVLVLMGGLGLACLAAAVRLGRGRGRMLQTFLACSLLLTFPIGTVFALYALWVCWAQPEVRRHLAPVEREPVRSADMGLLKASLIS